MFINMKITGGAGGLAGIPRETNILIVYIVVALTIWSMYRIQNFRLAGH